MKNRQNQTKKDSDSLSKDDLLMKDDKNDINPAKEDDKKFTENISRETSDKKSESLKETLTNVIDTPKEIKPEPKRGRPKGTTKAAQKEQEKAEEMFLNLTVGMGLMSLTRVVGLWFGDEWQITETKEAEKLAKVIINYLNVRFPSWKSGSPEFALIAGLSEYFTKRLIVEMVQENV